MKDISGVIKVVERIDSDVKETNIRIDRWTKELKQLETLGADPYLPRGLIKSFLRVFKYFALKIPRGKVKVF